MSHVDGRTCFEVGFEVGGNEEVWGGVGGEGKVGFFGGLARG